MEITVTSSLRRVNEQFNRTTFSYFITFDCDINYIENCKAHLRQFNYDKRVYMYNADEEEGKYDELMSKIKDKEFIDKYLRKRIKKVI